MEKLSDYQFSLDEIKQDCLQRLKFGCLAWPTYSNNSETKTRVSKEQQDSEQKIAQIQFKYMEQLHRGGMPPTEINREVRSDKHQFELRKQYALLSVNQIQNFGVAACNSLTQLAMFKVKERFPELIVKFAVLKHYNHAFAIIENPNNKNDQLVFDLFAHGFGRPVIYPINDLEKNMSAISLNKITKNEITPLNAKYHEVMEDKAPRNVYAVKLTLDSNEEFPQPIFDANNIRRSNYSMSSLCLKLGIFTTAAAIAVGSYYYFSNSEENNSFSPK